jgi:hypothetical protein
LSRGQGWSGCANGWPSTAAPSTAVDARVRVHRRQGTDIVVSNTEDTFVFPDGTLAVTQHPKESRDSFDEVTLTRSRSVATH